MLQLSFPELEFQGLNDALVQRLTNQSRSFFRVMLDGDILQVGGVVVGGEEVDKEEDVSFVHLIVEPLQPLLVQTRFGQTGLGPIQ